MSNAYYEYLDREDTSLRATIRVPKKVAKITVCGAVNFNIDDTMNFVRPTEEQIKNLRETFCIDVKLFDE